MIQSCLDARQDKIQGREGNSTDSTDRKYKRIERLKARKADGFFLKA
jgi:hypothetical protein